MDKKTELVWLIIEAKFLQGISQYEATMDARTAAGLLQMRCLENKKLTVEKTRIEKRFYAIQQRILFFANEDRKFAEKWLSGGAILLGFCTASHLSAMETTTHSCQKIVRHTLRSAGSVEKICYGIDEKFPIVNWATFTTACFVFFFLWRTLSLNTSATSCVRHCSQTLFARSPAIAQKLCEHPNATKACVHAAFVASRSEWPTRTTRTYSHEYEQICSCIDDIPECP